jgi:molybdopterin-guanine dinucleotide biosynthesis protein A
MFEGRMLSEHARDLLVPYVETAVIVGRDGPIVDLPSPDLGPLGGIAGALSYAGEQGFTSVLTTACDMPVLPALARGAPAYCPDAPVLGHWNTALLEVLLEHIAASPRRSVRGWAAAIGAVPIAAPAPIPNINTPEDIAAL